MASPHPLRVGDTGGRLFAAAPFVFGAVTLHLLTNNQASRRALMNQERADSTHEPDAELDLRGVICPYNFVKTKLKLETMEAGQILAVILDEGEPIANVPQSLMNEGHMVLSQEPLSQSYRLMIRKRPSA